MIVVLEDTVEGLGEGLSAALGPRPDHPGEERGCPRLGLRIGFRQLPRPAPRRVLDDPGHFNLSRLGGLGRLGGAGGDDGHGGLCMARAGWPQRGQRDWMRRAAANAGAPLSRLMRLHVCKEPAGDTAAGEVSETSCWDLSTREN
jgi:hypothetical protein